ncbi:hypothetical protein D3C87_1590190 [compost metagenome]
MTHGGEKTGFGVGIGFRGRFGAAERQPVAMFLRHIDQIAVPFRGAIAERAGHRGADAYPSIINQAMHFQIDLDRCALGSRFVHRRAGGGPIGFQDIG